MANFEIDKNYKLTPLSPNNNYYDFSGLVHLINKTDADLTVEVAVTKSSEDICPTNPSTITIPKYQDGVPGAYYLPVDAAGETTYRLSDPNDSTKSGTTLTVKGRVGSPEVFSANGAIAGWDSCWHNGTIVVRSDDSNATLTAHFDTDPDTTYTIGNGSHALSVPAGANTLVLDGTGLTSHTIDLINQTSPTLVLRLDPDLSATTRAVAVASGDSLELVITNTTPNDVKVESAGFDGKCLSSVTIPAPRQGQTATRTVTLGDSVAWLNIGYPPDGTPQAAVALAYDSGESGSDLSDDPVVVVKHTGCGGGQR